MNEIIYGLGLKNVTDIFQPGEFICKENTSVFNLRLDYWPKKKKLEKQFSLLSIEVSLQKVMYCTSKLARTTNTY